jgi:hypothetical protein
MCSPLHPHGKPYIIFKAYAIQWNQWFSTYVWQNVLEDFTDTALLPGRGATGIHKRFGKQFGSFFFFFNTGA